MVAATNSRTCRGSLLLVPLHHRGRADVGLFGILAGLAAGPALAEEIPGLVEGDLDGPEALLFLGGQSLAYVGLFEAVLLLGQFVDAVHQFLVVHVGVLLVGGVGPRLYGAT
jgi:hypothetical protein